jgi:S-adenosylmethionine hydrolase
VPIARDEDGAMACEVLWVDRFGNCQLNVSLEDLESAWGHDVERVRVSFSDVVRNVPVVKGFGDLGTGAVGLVIDSSGLLCLAVERGSATRELPLGEGEQVMLRPATHDEALSTPVDAPRKR